MTRRSDVRSKARIALALHCLFARQRRPLYGWLLSSLMQQQALTSTPPDFSPSSFTSTIT